jgi:hypothetical protein
MVALNPGATAKPEKREKAPRVGLRSGGRKSKDAGRSYEQRFARRYDEPDGPTDAKGKPLVHFKRVPGSGAFVELKGDVLAEIVALNLAFELKSWNKVDGRGEKTVTFPASYLAKIEQEASVLNRHPIFIYHIKGDSEEWAVVKYSWLHSKFREYELQIRALTEQLEEALHA